MAVYPTIRLYQGATSVVEIDLTNFDLQGGKIVFTMREKSGAKNVIKTWEFDEAVKSTITFTDEFTAGLKQGANYEYDVMWHLNGERFPQCDPSGIVVSRTVGGYPHGTNPDAE